MSMLECADLEIGLYRRSGEGEAETYEAEFRFSQPRNEVETRLDQSQPALLAFDLPGLRALELDWPAYGQELTRQFFTAEVRQAYSAARAAAGTAGLPLRLRLLIGSSAPQLHALRWETLRDPQDDSLLCVSAQVLFSRYLSSNDWRPVRLRPKGQLRALAMVASPANLTETFRLPALDVAQELAQLRGSIGATPLDVLGGPDKPASLTNLETCLRQVEYDILYLVCHGIHRPDGTYLYLEDDQGKVAITSGRALAERINDLPNRPRLVVLISCESAGSGTVNTLAGVGPLLAEAGIPAVIAMQSALSFKTAATFAPLFFKELEQDGVVDRACAAARSVVRNEADAWAPVLFMRMKTGRLWYEPGFGEKGGESRVWPLLMLRLKSYQTRPARPEAVTPVVGHGLVEPVLGSLRDIARRWSDQHHYPMAPSDRESLPQVAQYLATYYEDEQFPYLNLEESLRQDVINRFGSQLGEGIADATLDNLISRTGVLRRQDPCEAHRVLAGLPLPIYLTANLDSLMEDALVEAGKRPETILCPWFRDADQDETVFDREKYIPSKERPLVYHLFGRLDRPESVVLTEENFFDYLLGVARNKERIPKDVLRALASSTLLFIGFQLEDWNFRVLLRSILALSEESQERRPVNIAAQIEPDESRILEPGRARNFIEKYFTQDARVSLFWGGVDDFVRALQERWMRGS